MYIGDGLHPHWSPITQTPQTNKKGSYCRHIPGIVEPLTCAIQQCFDISECVHMTDEEKSPLINAGPEFYCTLEWPICDLDPEEQETCDLREKYISLGDEYISRNKEEESNQKFDKKVKIG